MRKEAIKAASALTLICGVGFTNVVKAEPARRLSENCKQAQATANSLLMSVPKILCLGEEPYEDALDKFMRETETVTPALPLAALPAASPAPGPKQRPKFPARPNAARPEGTKPKKTAK